MEHNLCPNQSSRLFEYFLTIRKIHLGFEELPHLIMMDDHQWPFPPLEVLI